MTEHAIDFLGHRPTEGTFDVAWNHGTSPWRRAEPEPRLQVHWYDEHTAVIRQSKAVNYEAPFLFLLLGNRRALLLDTGATADPERFPLREAVDGLLEEWLEKHPCDGYELVVAHTHGHHDHVAADDQLAGRPATTVVPVEAEGMRDFFGFGAFWPDEVVSFDLGGRVLELIGSPGHHDAAITVYDPWTGLLLTGDTVLPGRLFAFDFPAYLATLDRLVAFAADHAVTHVVGCHVEMTRRPGRDYPIGATYQPAERRPEMTVAQLVAVRDAAASVADRPGVHRFDDFVIYHEPGPRDMRRMVRRGKANLAWTSLVRRVRGTRVP